MMREPLEREPRHHSQDVVSPSFRKAIHAIVRPGDIVLDVDSPGGLCAFEACRAGAARVYAFESVPGLIVPLAVENGLADRIVAVRGSPLDADVPERADVLIATPHDSCGGDLLQLVVDARHRLLTPKANIIPSALIMKWAPIDVADWYQRHIDRWRRQHSGYSFSPGRTLAVNTRWDVHISDDALLAAPADLHAVPLRSLDAPRISSQARVAVHRDGTMHAIAAWFSATSETSVVIDNDPSEPVGAFPKQALFPIDRPIAVAAGDRIDVAIRLDTMDREMVWTWRVQAFDRSERLLAACDQSTFHSLLVGPDDLKKQAADFVPRLSERGWVARTVLQQLAAGRTVEESAVEIARELPTLVVSPRHAEIVARRVAFSCADTLPSLLGRRRP